MINQEKSVCPPTNETPQSAGMTAITIERAIAIPTPIMYCFLFLRSISTVIFVCFIATNAIIPFSILSNT